MLQKIVPPSPPSPFELTTLVLVFPSSPDVLIMCATIIASSSVVCTDEEKEALAAVDEAFDEAVAHIDEAVEEHQSQLMLLTGATASPEEIDAVIEAETNTTMGGNTTMVPTTMAGTGATDVSGATDGATDVSGATDGPTDVSGATDGPTDVSGA